MTHRIDKHTGHLFECDMCGDTFESNIGRCDSDSFATAWALAKESGFHTVKRGREWEHYCPDCNADFDFDASTEGW